MKTMIEDAIERVEGIFPFDGYIRRESRKYNVIAETVLRYLEPGSSILDFGCGPCDVTAVLQFLGFRCSSCDDLMDEWHGRSGNREKIKSFADKIGIDFRQTSDGTQKFEKNAYDMIMLNDVLEHLHDSPRDLLNDLLELAKPTGLLFVTVPNAVNVRKRAAVLLGRTNLPRFEGYYWYPGAWRGHVREYVRGDLVLLSSYLNLETLLLRGCDLMLEKFSVGMLRSAYVLATNAAPGLKDSWLLVAKKKRHWTPRKSLSVGALDRMLGRSAPFYRQQGRISSNARGWKRRLTALGATRDSTTGWSRTAPG